MQDVSPIITHPKLIKTITGSFCILDPSPWDSYKLISPSHLPSSLLLSLRLDCPGICYVVKDYFQSLIFSCLYHPSTMIIDMHHQAQFMHCHAQFM